MSRLEVKALSVRLGGRSLLDTVDLEMARGELVGLIGPNGAGKSTLVKAIAQLMPHVGHCRLDGVTLEEQSVRERAKSVAYLAQADTLQWPIAVQDLVALGRHPFRGSWWRGGGQFSDVDQGAIATVLNATGIDGLREQRVDTLSGGERALARLARALVVKAPLLLVDEPVAALDPRHQLNVMGLLRAECRRGVAVISVLHDLTLASRFCDRLLLIDQGCLVAAGSVESVLTEKNLREVYGIEALMASQRGQPYIVPWQAAAQPCEDVESTTRDS